MAYEIELWSSDRPNQPVGGGEVREKCIRVTRLAAAKPVLESIRIAPQPWLVRVTLSDTRGKMWDLWSHVDNRDTDLDCEQRELIDLRPAGAAVLRKKRRGC